MSLLNVQADPAYRALIDEVLDSLRPTIEASDPGMCYRLDDGEASSDGAPPLRAPLCPQLRCAVLAVALLALCADAA